MTKDELIEVDLNEDMQTLISQLRLCGVLVDQISKAVARGKGGRELALAKTKLQEAVMWVDEAILESENPQL